MLRRAAKNSNRLLEIARAVSLSFILKIERELESYVVYFVVVVCLVCDCLYVRWFVECVDSIRCSFEKLQLNGEH